MILVTGEPLGFRDTISLPAGTITLLDHGLPLSSDEYPNVVGGIAIEIPGEIG